MEVVRLPISASQRGKLVAAGYITLSSLSSVAPSHLARDLDIDEGEALEILTAASHGRFDSSDGSLAIVDGAQTAWDMLHVEEFFVRITSSCAELDEILGGGINCKEVTEIGFSLPSMFKFQLIMVVLEGSQFILCCIDTEGSFMVERALQLAEACIEDTLMSTSHPGKGFHACQFKMKPKDFLENIFYFRVCSYTEQTALINYLDMFIQEHRDVKVVIIDSFTFHFRQDFDDMALRTRVLGGMALKLMQLANKFNLPVVVLNQVTTKYSEGSFQLTLALGDSWSHACTNRIILYWNGDERYAYIDKSPSLRSASAPYSVTRKGIRSSASTCKRVRMM